MSNRFVLFAFLFCAPWLVNFSVAEMTSPYYGPTYYAAPMSPMPVMRSTPTPTPTPMPIKTPTPTPTPTPSSPPYQGCFDRISDPTLRAAVQSLVSQLADPSYAVREAASKALSELLLRAAGDGSGELASALNCIEGGHADLEVRTRLKAALQGAEYTKEQCENEPISPIKLSLGGQSRWARPCLSEKITVDASNCAGLSTALQARLNQVKGSYQNCCKDNERPVFFPNDPSDAIAHSGVAGLCCPAENGFKSRSIEVGMYCVEDPFLTGLKTYNALQSTCLGNPPIPGRQFIPAGSANVLGDPKGYRVISQETIQGITYLCVEPKFIQQGNAYTQVFENCQKSCDPGATCQLTDGTIPEPKSDWESIGSTTVHTVLADLKVEAIEYVCYQNIAAKRMDFVTRCNPMACNTFQNRGPNNLFGSCAVERHDSYQRTNPQGRTLCEFSRMGDEVYHCYCQ